MDRQNNAMFTSRIVFGAIFVSAWIYVLVAYILNMQGWQPAGMEPMVKYILAGAGAASCMSSVVLHLAMTGALGSRDPKMSVHSMEEITPKTPEEQAAMLQAAAAKYFTIMVVGLVLCESCAIMGLVIFLMTGDAMTQLLLTALGTAVMFVHFPTLSTIRRLAPSLPAN